MKKTSVKSMLIWILFLVSAVVLMVFALREEPIPVETDVVVRGPMQVTIDEEGEARAHDRFIMAAPVAGRLSRIELHDGDPVSEGQFVAFINPLPLSARERSEITSRVAAAEALLQEAKERAKQYQADYERAVRERKRSEKLFADGIDSSQHLDQLKTMEVTAEKLLDAAKFKVRAATSEVSVARSGLIALQPGSENLVEVRSPVTGRVLRILEKSERVLEAGTPLIILGDPSKLEVVVDVLSSDAVKIKEGDAVMIGDWGGERSLKGKVRVVELSAFTKVSALGVEEQRVNVTIDFIDSPERLGDGYRVECRIVIWTGSDVLKVPAAAVFRRGTGWNVFIVRGGKAFLQAIEIGNRNPQEFQVLSGLQQGNEVVVYPSNQLEDGARISKTQGK